MIRARLSGLRRRFLAAFADGRLGRCLGVQAAAQRFPLPGSHAPARGGAYDALGRFVDRQPDCPFEARRPGDEHPDAAPETGPRRSRLQTAVRGVGRGRQWPPRCARGGRRRCLSRRRRSEAWRTGTWPTASAARKAECCRAAMDGSQAQASQIATSLPLGGTNLRFGRYASSARQASRGDIHDGSYCQP
jgi:hypothetical protein